MTKAPALVLSIDALVEYPLVEVANEVWSTTSRLPASDASRAFAGVALPDGADRRIGGEL